MQYKHDELWGLVSSGDNWFHDKGKRANEQARQILLQFADRIQKTKPDKKYSAARDRLGHLCYLIPAYEAIIQGNYQRACNKLLSLMRHYPYRQTRILLALKELMTITQNKLEEVNEV